MSPAPNETTIDDLIQQAEDPVQRATLMVLGKIDSSLGLFVSEFTEHQERFKQFEERFDEHAEQDTRTGGWIMGAAYVGAALITVLCSVTGSAIVAHVGANNALEVRVMGNERELVVLKALVDQHHAAEIKANGAP